MTIPRVSVIVPNYNHARFLPRRIESILNQTYQNFEIVLLDDASTDNSREVIETFKDPRIRTCFNDKNSGSTFRQWNRGVREARGEYVWLAESDDYADPQLLEELVTRLEAHPGAGIAYCQSWQVDENDRKLGTMLWWTNRFHSERWQSDYVEHGLTECRRYFLHTCVIPNASATVIRRSCYLQAGGADETYRMVGDWCTYARILLISDVVYCHRPLNYFRCHSHSVRTSSTKSGVHVEEVCRVVDELLGRLDVLPAERREACDRLIGLWLTALLRDRIPLDRSLNVYRHLRKIQPDVHWRIFAKPLSALRKRLSPMPAFN